MGERLRLLLIASVGAFVLSVFPFATPADSAVKVGDAAPTFLGTDLAGGNVWVRKHFGKKPIVLSFDSAWSDASIAGLKAAERIRTMHPDAFLQVLSLNVDGGVTKRVGDFMATRLPGVILTPMIDQDWAVARQYGVGVVPTRFVIDAHGIVRHIAIGSGGAIEAKFAEAVEAVVKIASAENAAMKAEVALDNVAIDNVATDNVAANKVSVDNVAVGIVAADNVQTNNVAVNNVTVNAGAVADTVVIAAAENVLAKLTEAVPSGKVFRVVSPDGFTKTTAVSLTVSGIPPGPGSVVSMRLNGGSRKAIVPKGEIFFGHIQLQFGNNFIEVEATATDNVAFTQGVIVFREVEAVTGIREGLPSYSFHSEENESWCVKCHEIHPPEEKAKGLDGKVNPCMSCHREMADRRVVHGPIAIGGCSSCHRFSGGDGNRYELLVKGADLCFRCHEDRRGTKKFTHEPAEAGRCVACHDPHGSLEKYQHKTYISNLCYGCHKDVESLGGSLSMHEPFKKGRCDECHTAHGSDRSPKYLRLTGDRFCLTCHVDLIQKSHVHQSDETAKMKLPDDIKLDPDGKLTCRSCHQYHESPEPKLMQPGGCAKCH